MSTLLLLLSIATLLQPAHPWGELHKVDTTQNPLAVCLDGSPYQFYVDTVPNSSAHFFGWVLFFEGGGWCYSPADCLKRSRTYLGSSRNMSQTLTPTKMPLQWFEAEGPLSSDRVGNPLFSQYNRAFIKYCDGNSFTGQREEPLQVDGQQLYFRGRYNLEAAMDVLFSLGLGDATEVLTTGCSAGGLATLIHADNVGEIIKARAPALKIYKAAALSGYFPTSIPSVATGTLVYRDQIQTAHELHNSSGGVHRGCLSALKDKAETWRCQTAEGVYPHVRSPVFVENSVYDAWALACILTATPIAPGKTVNRGELINGNCSQAAGWEKCAAFSVLLPPSKCAPQQVNAMNRWRGQVLDLIQSAATYHTKGNGVFLHSCHGHCLAAATLTWNMVKIPNLFGTSIRSAIEKWWLDDTGADHKYLPCEYSNASSGRPLLGNCNPSCDIPM